MGGGYFSAKVALLCVGCLWALNIILNGPLFLWADVIAIGRFQQVCRVPHVDQYVLKIFPAIKNVFVFFVPLVITWMSYCRIVYVIRKSRKTVIISSSPPTLDSGYNACLDHFCVLILDF